MADRTIQKDSNPSEPIDPIEERIKRLEDTIVKLGHFVGHDKIIKDAGYKTLLEK